MTLQAVEKPKNPRRRWTKNLRLLKSEDFRAVLSAGHDKSKGRFYRGSWFVVYFENIEKSARLGVSISSKIIRTAPKRNRIKRCLREFFRNQHENFSGDILVRCTAMPPSFESRDLCKPLERLLRK